MSRRAKRKDAEFLTQCRVLSARWRDGDPSQFGLTELEVDQFEEMVLKAAESREKAQRARLLAKARFVGQREAFANLRRLFGALVGSVDVNAKRQPAGKRAAVYASAGIDPPEKGGPKPAPPAPTKLEYTMSTSGEVLATFIINDRGRGGLLYEVQRRLVPLDGACQPWLPLDIVADRKFVDADVPPGLRQVEYRVRAMRASGTKSDWSYPLMVPFGTQKNSGGGQSPGEAVVKPAA